MYYRDNRVAATSGHGGCYCGGQGGLSDAAALAAGAVAGFLLYQAITMAAAGRRKRSERANEGTDLSNLWDLVYAGKIYNESPYTTVQSAIEVTVYPVIINSLLRI